MFKSRAQYLACLMAAHDEFIVCGRMAYGGFSPDVKTILDHSIGYILPFFKIVNDETHHPARYTNSLSLRYLFYGSNISYEEREIARELVKANALNLEVEDYNVEFYDSPECAAEALW